MAIVSNHLIPRVVETLKTAGVEWAHFGLPANSVDLTPAHLAPFDAVVCIGRTVLLAAALGKPVIVWDLHGCDGVLDTARVDQLAQVNFSGRVSRAQPSPDELRAMLDACTTLDVGALQKVMKQRFALTTRAAEWEALYQQVLTSGTRLRDEHQRVYQPMFDLYWGEVQRSHILLPGELQTLRRETDQLRAQLEAANARANELEAQLAQSRDTARLLNDDVTLLRTQLDAAHAQLRAPGAEDALRLAEKANELHTSLLPEGTKRLDAFRTALHWARKKTR